MGSPPARIHVKTHTHLMIQKLTSRKLLAVLISAFVVALGSQLGFGEREVQSVVILSTGFILGQGIEGIAAPLRSLKDRLMSRKLWVYVGLTVFSAFTDEIGINPALVDWLATYFIGQGLSDFGKWRRSAIAFPS